VVPVSWKQDSLLPPTPVSGTSDASKTQLGLIRVDEVPWHNRKNDAEER
jgi:hypothetical protein